jgi:putative PIG3 family NAD(P)H quinone oxidoreductase
LLLSDKLLEVQDVQTPEPAADQVRVRVHAAGLNGADVGQRTGHFPPPPGISAAIPGVEFAGEIDAVGPLVQNWKPGQRVMGLVSGAGQAEYVVVNEGMLIAIPPNLDYTQAAAIPEVFITAHDALFTQGGLVMGQRVLIHTAGGGVGTAAIQLAHAAGATVFGTSRTPAKLERAKSLGLAVGFSAEHFATEIQALTKGEGVHLIIDFVGAAYMEPNLNVLGMWERLVILSILGGTQAGLDLQVMRSKQLQVRCCTLRYHTLTERQAVTQRVATQVVPLLASGRIKPVVAQVYPPHEIAAAHRALEENRNFGKLILSLDV